MGAGHGATAGLHHPGTTRVHRLAPEAKLVAALVAVLAIVATPRDVPWAFGLHALVVGTVVVAAALPARHVLRRLRIEVPFLAFAVFLPVVGADPRIEVLGVSLSEPGLWAAWNVAVKGLLGVLVAIVVAGTTPVADVLAGLERLRVPAVVVAVAGFMVRYLDVVAGEADRMRIARLSRGDDPRWLWQARAVAATAGTLFVRSYERGERVHLAMCARGYTGTMPPRHRDHTRPAWAWALVAPTAAVAVATLARTVG